MASNRSGGLANVKIKAVAFNDAEPPFKRPNRRPVGDYPPHDRLGAMGKCRKSPLGRAGLFCLFYHPLSSISYLLSSHPAIDSRLSAICPFLFSLTAATTNRRRAKPISIRKPDSPPSQSQRDCIIPAQGCDAPQFCVATLGNASVNSPNPESGCIIAGPAPRMTRKTLEG